MKKVFPVLVFSAVLLAGCSLAVSTPGAPTPTSEPQITPLTTPSPELIPTTPPAVTATTAAIELTPTEQAEDTAVPTLPVPTTQATFTPAATGRPEEAILILQPGPGSRITSPIRLSGEADPTFEQTLVVRVLTIDGEELSLTPVTLTSDIGQRGPFTAEIPFNVSGEVQALIQVYEESPRDGGITHLSSVGVLLADGGGEEIRLVDRQPERIHIFTPTISQTIGGGYIRVEGFALAGFEQHLMVELQDENGRVIASEPITVQAPDLGVPGPFSTNLSYQVDQAGPGRIVVRDPSPAYPADVHLSSVEINLQP